jgi:hypothetical protein
MSAVKLDITIEQGTDFNLYVTMIDETTGDPIDYGTDAAITGQVRDTADSSVLVAEFTAELTDHASGEFTVSIPAATTALITVPLQENAQRKLRRCCWDLNIDYSGIKSRLFEGIAYISPGATHD